MGSGMETNGNSTNKYKLALVKTLKIKKEMLCEMSHSLKGVTWAQAWNKDQDQVSTSVWNQVHTKLLNVIANQDEARNQMWDQLS